MKKTQNTKNKEKGNAKEWKNEIGLFLKEHVIKKAKVLFIIGIVITIIMIALFEISNINILDENIDIPKASLLSMLKERLILLILILLAGWVPYFYIPAIAYVAYVFILSGDMLINMELNGAILTLVINSIPILIDLFTVSVISAIGIYMSNYSTKKYKYTQRTSFSFLDIKIQFYQMTKNQDKYEKALAKKEKKMADMQKNDVKIDYKTILKIAPIMIGINLLVYMIQYFIN